MSCSSSSGQVPIPTAKSPVKKKKRDDFRFGPTLGEGSYSTVVLACEKSSGKEYALKILEKRHIVKEKKVPQVCAVYNGSVLYSQVHM